METLFWMIRPLACAQDASPAPLRLALHPAAGGVEIHIVKRRGPQRDEPLYLPLDDMPASTLSTYPHVLMDKRAPAARNDSPALV